VRDPFGLDHPGLFERDRNLAELLEEPNTATEQERSDADLDLVELPGTEQLLSDVERSTTADQRAASRPTPSRAAALC
jgi:hypothetical protein